MVFTSLPAHLRAYGLQSDVRTLLLLRKAIDRKLVKSLGDLYLVLKGIVVKDKKDIGPFTRAYYKYFLNIDIEGGDRLDDAILRSETFARWKEGFLDEADNDYGDDELLSKFLDEVHLTSYNIKEILDGATLFDQDDPDLADQENPNETEGIAQRALDRMADYSDLSLEELLERLQKIRDQQKSKHSGGNHWIGTGGISPFGHGGAAKDGIRVGGTGGGRMARKVLSDPNYYPVDMDAILNDNNVDAALAAVKGVMEESNTEELDVPITIKHGLKRGGLFLPEMTNHKEEKLQVILLIDNGGYSMSPYVKVVRDLFKKMKTRFAHDMEVYYFHNTIYHQVYEDPQRMKPLSIEKLCLKDKGYRIFVIGDAAMAPYELDGRSIRSLKKMTKKFSKSVWLNPEPEKYWTHTYTTQVIKQIFPMFPLTTRGIEHAVRSMNGKR